MAGLGSCDARGDSVLVVSAIIGFESNGKNGETTQAAAPREGDRLKVYLLTSRKAQPAVRPSGSLSPTGPEHADGQADAGCDQHGAPRLIANLILERFAEFDGPLAALMHVIRSGITQMSGLVLHIVAGMTGGVTSMIDRFACFRLHRAGGIPDPVFYFVAEFFGLFTTLIQSMICTRHDCSPWLDEL
jgi:hypothetical protein